VPAAFFSYSREDSGFVLRVAGDLKTAGANVWLDQMDIVPGQRWDEAVERALADCPRMLVVLSPAAVHSTNVMDEVSFALEEGKTVVPILYRDCAIPFRLRRVQYIDLRFDYSHGLAELLRILAAQHQDLAGTTPVADFRKQSPAVVPETAGHGDAVERAAPQEDHEPPKKAQSRTPLESEALPTSQERAPSISSAPPEPPVQQPLSDVAERKDGSAVVPAHSKKTKAAVAACGVLIVASVLNWGLGPVLTKHPVVHAATSKPPVSPGSSPGTHSGGNPGGEVNPSVRTGLPEVAPPISSPTTQPKGDVGTRGPTPKPPKALAPAEKKPTSPTSRKDLTPGAGDSSLAILNRRAQAGDSSAMVDLGMNYANGRGVPEDYQKAISWLRKASDAGDAAGMNNLGVMYANGYGVPKDCRQAAAWYRKAAEAGYVLAMANLGSMYENGKGVPKDSQQALGWYHKAAQAGSTSAMYDLGVMYENGEGVVKNREQAVEWYRKAAVLGEPHAKQSLQRLGLTP
jgi:hypothetical protein